MANGESEKHVKRLDRVTATDVTQREMVDVYNEWGFLYEKGVVEYKYIGYKVAAQTVKEFCPGKPSDTAVLDVGAGTGLIGKELHGMGFNKIDGIDPAMELLQKAKEEGFYRNLFCEFFTKEQLNIKEDSYDVIVTSGCLLNGHLPFDCLQEMVRLVKPGGIVCIVTRASSFDNKTVPAYVDKLVPLMKDLETKGKWKQKVWETFPEYFRNEKGCKIVYEIC